MIAKSWQQLAEVCRKKLGEVDNPIILTQKTLFYYGIALYKQERYKQSILAFESQELITDPQAHYALAMSCFKMENYSKAVDSLQRTIALDPRHIQAYNNLAFIYNMH